MRPQAANKGIAFSYNRAVLPASVTVDAKRLRQILLNLLSNAIKYTQSGSVTLNVRYASEVATFEVIDTGVGIPGDDLDRIFEPFERGRMDDCRRGHRGTDGDVDRCRHLDQTIPRCGA